jgi:hypothetical protein
MWHDSGTVGVPVRVHDLEANDLGIAHIPLPVEVGDVLEFGHVKVSLALLGSLVVQPRTERSRPHRR